MKSFKPKTIHLIGLGIFILSLLLRISLISKGPYHGDTIALIIQAEKTIETLRLQKQSALGFPMIVLLASLFIYLSRILSIGTTALAVNSISVLFSSLAVWAFYYLSLEIYEHFQSNKNDSFRSYQQLAAILSSILFSLSPIFLGISVYGKNHAPCLFFLFLGILQLLRFFRLNKSKNYLYSILWLGFCGATRILDLVLMGVPLSFLFIALSSQKKTTLSLKTNFSKLCLWWLSIGIVTFVFYLPYFFQQNSENFFGPLNQYLDRAFFNNFIGLFSHKLISTYKYLVKNFTFPGILISIVGLFYLCKLNQKTGTFLVLWILIPTFFYGNLHMTMTSRYFVIILPPILFSMAFVFSNFQNKKRFFQVIAMLLFFGITSTTFMRIYPLLKRRHNYDDVPSFVRWFKQTAEPNAQIIHGDGSVFYHYYGNVSVARRPLSRKVYSQEKLIKFKNEIDLLIKRNIPVYINSVGLFAYNREGSFSDFVFDHYALEYIGSHNYEDWHGGAMEDRRIKLNVYKLSLKNEDQ